MTIATPVSDRAEPIADVVHVAIYLRVSTGSQAENDLSIPDQRRQTQSYCQAKGWRMQAEFVEPGKSATDDRRPAFQAMIDAALVKPPTFTIILVHSFSRFFRDQFQFEFYLRKLAKNGVRLISITQELSEDPLGIMVRKIMTLFDEYQSKENGKHTLRAMKENARQGYWNGTRPPIGYRIVAADQRGSKLKKKLDIDPLHADTVRLIFRLALAGDGQSGAMGVKAITKYLNGHHIRTRDGGIWGMGAVYKVLTRESYIGRHRFNMWEYKTHRRKPESEHTIQQIPAIISETDFLAVQANLKARAPSVVAPRTVSGPTMLTGLCFCGNCNGAMTLRAGKGKCGGYYRYYACSTRMRKGDHGCRGLSVPMHKLDDAVVAHLETRLLNPQRLTELMADLLERREEWMGRRRAHVTEMRKRATEAELKLKRLFEAIEEGIANVKDPSLKDRIAELSAIRDQAHADADRASAVAERVGPRITPGTLNDLALKARKMLRNGDGTYRRDHLRALAQRVEVVSPHEAIIKGSKTELLRALAVSARLEMPQNGVHSFVPKWCALGEGNDNWEIRLPRASSASFGLR